MNYQKTSKGAQMSPSNSKQFSFRPMKTNSNQIEDSLIERHRKSQASIRTKKRKQTIKESELNPGIPSINESSRSMVKLELDNMFKNKRLGKEVSSSIRNSFRKSVSEVQNIDLTLDISNWNITYKTHHKHISDLSKEIPDSQTKSGLSYESVKKTFISNLKKTKPLPDDNKYTHNTNLAVEERTNQWMKHKNMKIQKLRESSQEIDLKECTFKPSFHRTSLSTKTIDKQSVRTVEYSPIHTTGKQMNYSSGFDLGSFMKRSKPLINYKHASVHI